MEIYFDNAATTRALDSVRDTVARALTEDYGNPSSKHMKGLAAERCVRQAARTVAGTLGASEKEIIFTSGGSESNNLAIIGAALANRRRGQHVIISAIEHPSVYNPVSLLEESGFSVTVLPVDGQGHVSPADLKEALRGDTVLVSVMYVNNEIGAVQPVAELGRIIREKNPQTLFHVDAIQAYGKYRIRPGRDKIDLLSVSGHKIHGPKGTGFLYVREGVRLKPQIYGGGQQGGLRSGTENVPGIAGLGIAAGEAYADLEEKAACLISLKDYMIDRLSALKDVRINSEKGALGAPHIVSASFPGVRSEVLLNALAARGICVSSGSACSSHHPGISGTLKGIGLPDRYLDATIRFSFGVFNRREEIDVCMDALTELLPQLRRFRPR